MFNVNKIATHVYQKKNKYIKLKNKFFLKKKIKKKKENGWLPVGRPPQPNGHGRAPPPANGLGRAPPLEVARGEVRLGAEGGTRPPPNPKGVVADW
jgi:hypothetical protein